MKWGRDSRVDSLLLPVDMLALGLIPHFRPASKKTYYFLTSLHTINS